MFWYMDIDRNALSEENEQIYQAYYGGLCQVLRKDCGVTGQMLSGNATFLVILLTGLYGLHDSEIPVPNPKHPGRKQSVLVNDATRYAADMDILLSYYDFVEGWKSDRNYPKHVGSLMMRKHFERVRRKYPRQAQAVMNYCSKLEMLERKRETNIDAIAGLTGEMLGEIFCWREDVWAGDLRSLGFYVGKFLHLMDSYLKLARDQKRNEYNAFDYMEKNNPEDFELFSRLMLDSMISQCQKTVESFPALTHTEILENILQEGVWQKYEQMHHKRERKIPRPTKKQAHTSE